MSEVVETSVWGERAHALLQGVVGERDRDVIPDVEAALACLRIEMGELPEDAMVDYFEPEPTRCTCPPDLLARGGFKGGCPVHAT